jgi:hypothetical protein
MGINDIIFHTFQHQPLGLDGPKPGMAMGPHGIHWHRHQTFWPMVRPYHDYIARCGQMLRQGVSVADILYLVPEGAPHIFLPPEDAMLGQGLLREKKGYGFDAVSPGILMARAKAEDGRIAFHRGTSYRLLVLPACETMTPELLAKIEELIREGVTVVGQPPLKSPSLSGYPGCDKRVREMAEKIWVGREIPAATTERTYGKGRVVWGGDATRPERSSDSSLMHQHSQWIWAPEGDPAKRAPAEITRYFQKLIHVDARRTLRAARVQITADNEFELWVNGQRLASGNNFNRIESVDIRSALKSGDNVLAVAAFNAGSEPNPAGLIALVNLQYDQEEDEWFGTDQTWRVARQEEAGWQREPKAGTDWREAKVLGPASMAPWSNVIPKLGQAALYPTYESTAALLRRWGIAPAFRSTGPLRHHQRRTESRDIFFVANRGAEHLDVVGVFRTDGAAPGLWDPVTGSRRPLPRFIVEGETVSLPLRFAAHESYFVVFDRKTARSAPQEAEENFPDDKILATLEGPYEVTFDRAWGGPLKPVTFDALTLWNNHANEDIRYYSGEAVYSKTFDLPSDTEATGRTHLDLGAVHKLARVKLNGEELGIVWTAPFRVDVTGKLRPAGNLLEVTVVNTWVNRLIGDQQPAHKDTRKLQWKTGLLAGTPHPAGRYTFTTAKGDYTAGSPLQESGLLGPVTLRITR